MRGLSPVPAALAGGFRAALAIRAASTAASSKARVVMRVAQCESQTDGSWASVAVRADGEIGAPERSTAGSSRGSLADRLGAILLPRGYPTSVGSGYLPFSMWHGLHVVTGTVTGVLSMQGLLLAVGLGAGAVPLAGAINFILKDGIGQLGGVLYASLSSRGFDADPKRHRFSSVALLQLSGALEVLTPLAPGLFLPLASLANVGKNIAYLGMGASRAQINAAFALQENMGDVTGKATAQSIAASAFGTAIGVAVGSAIGTDPLTILGAYAPLSVLSLYATFRSTVVAAMRTLNAQRADLCFDALVHAAAPRVPGEPAALSLVAATPTPEDIARVEQFVWPRAPDVVPLVVDAPVAPLLASPASASLVAALRATNDAARELYVLWQHPQTGSPHLWFHQGATADVVLKGYVHARLLRAIAVQNSRSPARSPAVSPDDQRAAHRFITLNFDLIRARLTASGWLLAHEHISNADRRIRVDATPSAPCQHDTRR